MRNLKISIFTLIILISFKTNIFAQSDILAVLEQPAISYAKSGDKLDYKLIITLPEDYKKRYSSFSATIMIDKNLIVKKYNLSGAKLGEDIVVNKSNIKNTKRDLLSLNVNDVNKLSKKILELNFTTEVKKDIEVSSAVKNSFVITYVNKDGNINTKQKNLQTNTLTTQLELVVDPIYTDSNVITGKTEKGAKVWARFGNKFSSEISKDGKFSLKVLKDLDENEEILMGAAKGDKKIVLKPIVKTKNYITKDLNEKIDLSQKSSKEILTDYNSFSKNINISRTKKEDAARLVAKIAESDYILIKEDATQKEIEDALTELKSAIKIARPALMKGKGSDIFSPNKEITRAEVASIFKRIIHGEEKKIGYSKFKDIDSAKWYAGDIFAVENDNIINGYSDNSFKPEKSIKRSEFASIVYRYLKLDKPVTKQKFKDVDSSNWAADAIYALYENNIFKGVDEDHFMPNRALKRKEAARIINILAKRQVDKEFLDKYSKNPFKDVSKKDWAYYEILEISAN